MFNRINEIDLVEGYAGTCFLGGNGVLPGIKAEKGKEVWQDEDILIAIDTRDRGRSGLEIPARRSGCAALFFGEIYNFDELADHLNWPRENRLSLSCSELCCYLYRKEGAFFAKRINGSFSFVLYDLQQKSLQVIVDRFGLQRPVYYSLSKDLCFGSHLKRIVRHGGLKREVDGNALALFLKYSYIPSPETIFKGIQKLGPGEMITCKQGRCKVERYSDFDVGTRSLGAEEAVEEYRALLAESVANKAVSRENQRVGLFLSGGLDSSANVALATMSGKKGLSAFTIGFEDPGIDERPFSRIAANRFGVPLSEYIFDGSEIEDLPALLWYLEEPFLENGLFLTYAGFKAARGNADVIISGNCADQLFGTGGFAKAQPVGLMHLARRLCLRWGLGALEGSMRANRFRGDNALFKLKVLLRRAGRFNDWFFWGFDDQELGQLCRFPLNANILHPFKEDLSEVGAGLDDLYQFSIIHQDVEHYGCQNVIVKSNRVAEMFGIRNRDSFLDYRVTDFILGLPRNLKRKGAFSDYLLGRTTSKWLHRQAVAGMLPKEILEKPKQGGAISMAILMGNSERQKAILNRINKSEILRSYLKGDAIERIVREYEELCSRPVYWQSHRDSVVGRVLSLLTFLIWHEVILTGNLLQAPDYGLSEYLEQEMLQ